MASTRVDTRRWLRFSRLINPAVRVLIRRFGVGGSNEDLLRSLRVRSGLMTPRTSLEGSS